MRTQTTDWTDPGAHEVADRVHRIPLPLPNDGLRAVNVYVIESSAGLTCVDGGWALEASRRQLEQSLRSIGYRLEDINSFLVTHAHRDHFTQAVAIRSEFGRATVTLGAGDRASIDHAQSQSSDRPVLGQLLQSGAADLATKWAAFAHATQPGYPDDWQYPDTWLEGDSVLTVGDRSLNAVATPGHTVGHYVFADLPAGLLFAGDHVLPTITPSIGFEPQRDHHPLRAYLRSLAKVRALPDLRLLPAHGAPTTSSHERIDQLLEHHEQRLADALAAVRGGAHTALEVATQLTWTNRKHPYAVLDVFNQGLAIVETLFHLDLLWIQGRASRTQLGNVYHYAEASPVSTGPAMNVGGQL